MVLEATYTYGSRRVPTKSGTGWEWIESLGIFELHLVGVMLANST